MKICSTCKSEKPYEHFAKVKGYRDGYRGQCKKCTNLRRQTNGRSETKEQNRKYNLKRYFNLTPEDFDAMIVLQNNKCAICGNGPDKSAKGVFHIDHDHITGKIRALLCSLCNVGLGAFRDSPKLLEKASRYIAGF